MRYGAWRRDRRQDGEALTGSSRLSYRRASGRARLAAFSSTLLVATLVVVLCTLSTAQTAHAFLSTGDGTWVWQNPLPQGNSLSAVSCPTSSTCFAVGGLFGYGTILATSNGGGTWTVQSPGTSQAITGVSCPSTTACFAVGGSATILGTSNGGATWTAQSSGSTDYLLGISCPSTTSCFAVGRSSTILSTSNGGGTWTAQSGSANGLSGISCPSTTTCFAVGSSFTGTSTILATSNGGGTWTMQSSGTTYELYGVSCPSTTSCFAVGSSGTILATSNGGGTWTAQSSGSANYLYGVSCPITTNCFAVGGSSTLLGITSSFILGTSNGGGTWTAQSSGSTNYLYGVSCPTTTNCFTVGGAGTILGTSNGGSTWTAQSSGGTNNLSGITCPTTTTCFAVGSSGTVLGTSNGGSTWAALNSGSTNPLLGVSCPSTTTCFAVGSSGTILSTTNGGASWTAQTSGTSIDLRGINCPNTTTCFAVGGVFGGNSTILATTNAGSTWATQPSGALNLYAVSCPSTTTCFAVGDYGTIITTSNGGGTWTAQTPGTSNFFLLSVSCPTTTTCFAVGSSGTILGTSNGGSTWTAQTSGIGTELDGVSCPSTTICFAVNGQAYCGCGSFGGPHGGTILATTNGGGTWAAQSSGTTNQLTGVFCPGTTTCFAVGDGGTILANGTPPVPTGIRVVAGDGEATLTWRPPSAGAPITGYTIVASPDGATTTVSAVVPAATISGLTNGTPYTFTVAAINAVGTGPASPATSAVTPTSVAQGPSVAVLPAMADQAYGGYLTAAYLQNVGASAAHIRVQYFDTSGNSVGFGNSAAGLAAGATWTLRTDNAHSLAATQAGSAVVYSDQPLAIFVNEFAPRNTSDATSYTSITVASGTGSTIYAPTIVNNAYGGYTTGIVLVSLATVPANITVTYRDGSGATITTQNLPNVAAGAYQALYSGTAGLPSGFGRTATITSSGGNLGAVGNQTGPGGQFSSYDAVPAGSTTSFAPVALNNAYGGYNTGMAIQNTTGSAGTVTITYYDSTGTATGKTAPIVANGYVGAYQGTDIPSAGAYTAKLASTVAIAAHVNEVAPSSNPAVQQSTAYNTFAAGSSSLHLPLVDSAGRDGWSTGEGIMNTGTAATTVTVTYYDAATGLQVGTVDTLSLQPNAFWGLYQPTGGLPAGERASAVVTTSSGGQVAVICNESNSTTFMSYGAQ